MTMRATIGAAKPNPQRSPANGGCGRHYPHDANICILVPIRDAARHVGRCVELIDALDLPKKRTRLVFCEGDSRDDTFERLRAHLEPLRTTYRQVRILRFDVGTDFGNRPRWHTSIQRRRRAAIAKVRNHLVSHAVNADDDWVLWIDADVTEYPPDIVSTLMAADADIIAPHCVREPGGQTFDLNSFLEINSARDAIYWKHCRDGIFQPPSNYSRRVHLQDLRYIDRVPLTGVGGTMLLVRAALHRAGLTFPERPYKELIETEAFGRLANDLGLSVKGLPNVEIIHAPD